MAKELNHIDISSAEKKIILSLIKTHLPNTTVWAYGSRATWSARPKSDLDLVAFASADQKNAVYDLKEAFEESDLPFRVDFFVWDQVPDEFRVNIERERVVLVEDPKELKQKSSKLAGWINTTIGEQATLQRGFDITRKEQREGTVPVISSSGIKSYHDTSKVNGSGVVMGRKGTLGSVFYLEGEYWPHDTTLWVKDFHGNDPKYVYYFFKNMCAELLSMDVGAANPTLNRNHVHPLKVLWPNKLTQKAIAHILGTIDDKIDLNRRMNETLEAMAQAIFKSWFVDFDGCTEFEDSELGRVPKGWQVVELGDYVTVKRGGSPRPIRDFVVPEGLPWLKIADATANNCPFIYKTKEFIKEECLKKTVLLQKRALILSSATPGLPRFLQLDACIHDGWLYFPEKKIFTDHYLYHLFLILRKSLISKGNGSVFTNLKTAILKTEKVVLPPKELILKFEREASELLGRVNKLSIESSTLANLRDTLLPKLISGELRVDEAEKMVEGA